jgi:hypothetical protein
MTPGNAPGTVTTPGMTPDGASGGVASCMTRDGAPGTVTTSA